MQTTQEKLYTTREAVAYLVEKLGREIKPDTFRHIVHRGIITPIADLPKSQGYRFTQEELDKVVKQGIRIRSKNKTPEALEALQNIPIIASSEDMARIAKKHGEIIDTHEAEKIIHLKHPQVSLANIRETLRVMVGAVGRIGHSPKKANTLLYSKSAVEKFANEHHFIVKPSRKREEAKAS